MSIFFWCAKENARKRKAHEPFPLDTRPPPRKHTLGGSFLLARHMRPQTRFRSDSAGLCGRLCRPFPSPLSGSSAVCAAACGGWFFDISNLNVRKCQKRCHSEELSDEESLMISLSFKRFFAALRMTKWAFRPAKTFHLSLLTFHLFFVRPSLHSLNYSCTQRTGKPYERKLRLPSGFM